MIISGNLNVKNSHYFNATETMNASMHKLAGESKDGWIDGWTEGWKDGWMDEKMIIYHICHDQMI